jgi:phage gp16-like protein
MQQDRLHDAPRTLRRPLIARVHMARKELALSEDSYRAVLARITGRHSAADLTVPQLLAVITEFERLGLRPRRVRSDKPHVREIYAIRRAPRCGRSWRARPAWVTPNGSPPRRRPA